MSPSTDSRDNRESASEVKFLISPQLAEQISGWARARLCPDPHAGGEAGDGYELTSLYFDTDQFDVFHRRGSFDRSKHRIRRYGRGATAFLERKLKTRELLTKRRTIVGLDELEKLSRTDAPESWAGDWFHRRLLIRNLKPVCQISYHRTARVALTPLGPIRLTLDNNLRALPAAGLRFSDGEGSPVLNNRVILEMKFRHAMPSLFKYLVEEFALTPRRFSKYRRAASCLGLLGAPASGDEENLLTAHA